MGYQAIETGYKPEFGLGALYQGFNAANADQLSEEEILKQFLANQRAQQEIPLDMQNKELTNQGLGFDMAGKRLAAEQADLQRTPTMLQSFVDSKQAGYDETIRKNKVGKMLQPFIEQQLPLEQGAKTAQLDIAKQIADIDKVLAGGADPYGNVAAPNQLPLWEKERAALVARLGNTPELAGKTALENVKGQWDYDKAIDAAKIMAQSREHSGSNATSQAAVKLAGQATQEVNVLNAQLTKLQSKEGEMEFNQNFLKVPEAQRTAAYRESINSMKQQLAEAKRVQQHYMSMTGVPSVPEQAQSNTPPAKMTLDKLRTMYPGIPDDRLKSAYKTKFGEDL